MTNCFLRLDEASEEKGGWMRYCLQNLQGWGVSRHQCNHPVCKVMMDKQHWRMFQPVCGQVSVCEALQGVTSQCGAFRTATRCSMCLWYRTLHVNDFHHHLRCCVWKAGLAVVALSATCLPAHIPDSAALTRLHSQDAEQLSMRIHKFPKFFFWHSKANYFSLSLHLSLSFC